MGLTELLSEFQGPIRDEKRRKRRKKENRKKERENLEELDHHSVCDGSTPWTTNEHPALL